MSGEKTGRAFVELAKFEEADAHLCRASSLSLVLKNFGAVYKSNQGSKATYELSKQVTEISAFISHNWVTPRWKKVPTIMLHFNSQIAWCTCFVLSIVICALYAAFDMPYTYHAPQPEGILFRVFFSPVFLVALLTAREFPIFQGGEPMVFLDKTCIFQEDPDLMKRGIMKLAAFLERSKEMLVIYTHVYLQKLWTVYEVAALLSLHPLERLKFHPTSSTITVIGGVILSWFANIIPFAVRLSGLSQSGWVGNICLGVCVIGYNFYIRRVAKFHRRDLAELKDFSVARAKCAVESDRPIVYANIAALMRVSRRLPEETTEAECLEIFDKVVRKDLHDILDDSMGSGGLSFKHIGIICLNLSLPICLDVFVGFFDGVPLKDACIHAGLWLGMGIFYMPLVCMGMAEWNAHCMKLTGCLNLIYAFVGSMGCVFIGNFLHLALINLRDRAVESESEMWMWLYFSVLMIIVVIGVAWMVDKKWTLALRRFWRRLCCLSAANRDSSVAGKNGLAPLALAHALTVAEQAMSVLNIVGNNEQTPGSPEAAVVGSGTVPEDAPLEGSNIVTASEPFEQECVSEAGKDLDVNLRGAVKSDSTEKEMVPL